MKSRFKTTLKLIWDWIIYISIMSSSPGMLGLLDRAFSFFCPTTNCQFTKLKKPQDLQDYESPSNLFKFHKFIQKVSAVFWVRYGLIYDLSSIFMKICFQKNSEGAGFLNFFNFASFPISRLPLLGRLSPGPPNWLIRLSILINSRIGGICQDFKLKLNGVITDYIYASRVFYSPCRKFRPTLPAILVNYFQSCKFPTRLRE